jgi:hypothetical protein
MNRREHELRDESVFFSMAKLTGSAWPSCAYAASMLFHQLHAALGAVAGLILNNLRMHRTGVLDLFPTVLALIITGLAGAIAGTRGSAPGDHGRGCCYANQQDCGC